MRPEEIREFEDLFRVSTDGPWEIKKMEDGTFSVYGREKLPKGSAGTPDQKMVCTGIMLRQDAETIANGRNFYLGLLGELHKLRRYLDDYYKMKWAPQYIREVKMSIQEFEEFYQRIGVKDE